MEKQRCYLGFDFGASSGRAILGRLNTEGTKTLEIEEIYRFPNEAVLKGKHLVWETERMFQEMKTALNIAFDRGVHIDSIGIDTWGVDFGLIDKEGNIAYMPVSYRDERTNGLMERAFEVMPKAKIFEHTGLAFMQFNTLYQLIAMQNDPEERQYLDGESYTLLFMPDLFAYYLTGCIGTEYTIASTSQLIDPHTRGWSAEVLDAFHIDYRLFAPLTQPGSIRGYLKKEVCDRFDYDIPVIAVASHDTASAVAAVPAREGERFAYISSGTWSLIGAETLSPVCTGAVMDANFTNEGGLNGTTRMLKNVMGLWIIQECRKQFNLEREAKGLGALSFGDIVNEVEALDAPAREIIDVDDDLFFAPGRMADKICEYVSAHGGKVDEGQRVGAVADIVYRSLALKYRWALECIEKITEKPVDALYIVGGGGKNELLNRYTAQAIRRPVRIGAGEGTVIGNLLVQAMGLGDVKDLWELRKVVRNSFGDREYGFDSAQDAQWEKDYQRLLALMA